MSTKTQIFKACELGKAQLFIMPKPSSEHLDADISFYKAQGVTKVLSLLLPNEIEKLKLQNQEQACLNQNIKYQNFAIKDMSVPELQALKTWLNQLKSEMASGESIAVHCHGGRGRAGTVVTTLMIEHGYSADQAIEIVSKARGDKVPVNELQTEFVINYPAPN